MTDEYADARFFSRNITFGGIFSHFNFGPANRCQQLAHFGGRSTALHYGFGNILGSADRAAQEHALAARQRLHIGLRLGKPELVAVYSGYCGHIRGRGLGFQADGQHHHVEFLFNNALAVVLGHIADDEVIAVRRLFDRRHLTANIANVVVVLRAVIKTLETFPESPEIDVEATIFYIDLEDSCFDIGFMFLGDDCFLGGVHAAHRRAIRVSAGRVAGTHALDPCDPLGRPTVGRAFQVSLGRARSAEDALELYSRQHIGIPPKTVFGFSRRIKGIEAAGQDYRTDFQILFSVLYSIVNGSGGTDLFARAASSPCLKIDTVLGIDDGHKGNGLREGDVDGPPVTKFGVEFVGNL